MDMETYNKEVAAVVSTLIETSAVKTTKYVGPKLIIRAVRKRYGKKISNKSNVEITLTIGRPNYAEREFIKLCKKAKEPFPVKQIQIKHGRDQKKK